MSRACSLLSLKRSRTTWSQKEREIIQMTIQVTSLEMNVQSVLFFLRNATSVEKVSKLVHAEEGASRSLDRISLARVKDSDSVKSVKISQGA